MELSQQSPPTSEASLEPPVHFDGLIGDKVASSSGSLLGEPEAAIMTREEFQRTFVGGFDLTHAMSKLQSLKIDEDGKPRAHGCADAIYDTALDVPSLRFLIQPKNKWWSRIFAIGMFTLPMAKAVSIELRERQVARAAKQPTMNFTAAKQATTGQPPQDGELTPEQRAALTGEA